MVSPSSSLNCAPCSNLISELRKQISAFKILASLSNLSWEILVKNIEELLNKSEEAEHINCQNEIKFDVNNLQLNLPSTSSLKRNKLCNGQVQEFFKEAVGPSVKEPAFQDDKNDENGHHLYRLDNSFPVLRRNTNLQQKSVPGDHVLTSEKLKQADEHIKRSWKNGKQAFQCLLCKRFLSNIRDVRLHVRRIHFNDRYKCLKCPRLCYDPKELRTHRATCEGSTKKEREFWKNKVKERERILKMNIKKFSNLKEEQESKAKSIRMQRHKLKSVNKMRGGQQGQKKKVKNTFDLKKLVIRNAFSNFDLNHSMSAYVKLERAIIPSHLIPMLNVNKFKKSKLNRRGRGRTKFCRPKKRVGQKNSVLTSVFGQRKLPKLKVANTVRPRGRPRKDQSPNLKENNEPKNLRGKKKDCIVNNNNEILGSETLEESHLNLNDDVVLNASKHFILNSVATQVDSVTVKHDNDNVDGVEAGTVSAGNGNFLTNFDYESQYRDFPEMILNQFGGAGSHNTGCSNILYSAVPLAPSVVYQNDVLLQEEIKFSLESSDEIQVLEPFSVENRIYPHPSPPDTHTDNLIPLTPIKVIKNSHGEHIDADKNVIEMAEAILDMDSHGSNDSDVEYRLNVSTPSEEVSHSQTKASLTEVDRKITIKGNDGKPYECKICLKTYGNVTLARRHVRQVHFNERYECLCGKKYYARSQLTDHQKLCKAVRKGSKMFD